MSHHRTSSSLVLLISGVLAALGCGDDKVESDTAAGPSTGGPATVTVGPGPGGGDASGGGAPGSGGGGGGPGAGGAATGGDSSTSTTGSGIPDECGEPGDCAGDQPTACAANACNAPEIDFLCEGSDDDLPAHVACSFAEEVYRTGVWARFVDCLREGDADTQCNDGEALVEACVASTLADACPNDAADVFCDGMANLCAGEGEPFAVDACKEDLKPFSENCFDLYTACIDLPDVAGRCNRSHQECFDEYAPP